MAANPGRGTMEERMSVAETNILNLDGYIKSDIKEDISSLKAFVEQKLKVLGDQEDSHHSLMLRLYTTFIVAVISLFGVFATIFFFVGGMM